MKQARMAAHECILPFARDIHERPNNNKAIIRKNKRNCQIISRIFIDPAHHKKRFPLLEKAKKNIVQSFLSPLSNDFEFGKVFYNPAKLTKSAAYRKRRVESRESIATQLGRAILHYVNLKTMTLGHLDHKSGKFIYYSIGLFKNVCKMSYKTAWRAMKVLVENDYIVITERKKLLANGTYRSSTPIISVNEKLFYDLGISEKDLSEGRYRETALLKKLERIEKKELYKSQSYAFRNAQKKIKKTLRTAQKKSTFISHPEKAHPHGEAKKISHFLGTALNILNKLPPS